MAEAENRKLKCMHDGAELTAANIEYTPRPHVVLEFTLKVGRVAAGTLLIDSANINPMLVSPEHSRDLHDALSAFKEAMEKVFVRYHGVMHSSSEDIEEGTDPIEL